MSAYKPHEIPEIATGQRILSKATNIIDYVDTLNAKYFCDKDYELQISGNFDPLLPLYSVTLNTKCDPGYSFDIFKQEQFNYDDIQARVYDIEVMLANKRLGVFILNNFGDRIQAKNNYINMIRKGN